MHRTLRFRCLTTLLFSLAFFDGVAAQADPALTCDGNPIPRQAEVKTAMILAAIAYEKKFAIKDKLKEFGDGWVLEWGPGDNCSNQAYIASRTDPTSDLKEWAVAIRGSLPPLLPTPNVYENWVEEDFAAYQKVDWIDGSVTGAKISIGAWRGLEHIMDMREILAPEHSISEFLSAKATSGAKIYVVGHSLGGTLVPVVAAWLEYELREMQFDWNPISFAAASAGNTAFSQNYNSIFPNSIRIYRNLDLVPFYWDDLGGIQDLFPNPGVIAPLDILDLVHRQQSRLADSQQQYPSSYLQTNGAGTCLDTAPPDSSGSHAPTVKWLTQVLFEHNHCHYLTAVGVKTQVGKCIPKNPSGFKGYHFVQELRGTKRLGQTSANSPDSRVVNGSASLKTEQCLSDSIP
jgi:hypothetical protein